MPRWQTATPATKGTWYDRGMSGIPATLASQEPLANDPAAIGEVLHGQWQMLWDDEVRHAETIHSKRRTFMVGLVVLAGLGIINMDLYRPAGHILAIPLLAAIAVRVVVVLALIAGALSAYMLTTERPMRQGRNDPPRVRGRASAELVIASVDADRIIKSGSVADAWNLRSLAVAQAWSHLCERNRQVRERIKWGLVWMGIAYLLVGVAFFVYSLADSLR